MTLQQLGNQLGDLGRVGVKMRDLNAWSAREKSPLPGN